MDAEKRNLIYLFGSFCLLVLITVSASYLNNSQEELNRSSRSIASISSRSSSFLLTQSELLKLKNKDLEKYLRGVAKILAKAGKRNPKLFYGSSLKTSDIWVYLTDEAFAASFAKGCFVGFVPTVKENCGETKDYGGIKISSSSVSQFNADFVDKAVNDASQNVLVCPSGKGMCSPAIFGFNFNASGKAELICVKNATGQACYDEVSTEGQGDRLKKSLELLKKANPAFWNELAKGIVEICKPAKDVKLKDRPLNLRQKTDCSILLKQLKALADDTRGGLKQYKDLYALAKGEKTLAEVDLTAPAEGELDASKTLLCSEVEKSYKAKTAFEDIGYTKIKDLKGSEYKDGTKLLEYAGLICNKPLSHLVSQYGVCKRSITNRVDIHKARRASSTTVRKAQKVLNLIKTLPEAEQKKLTPDTSRLKAKVLLTGAGKSEEQKKVYEAWEQFVAERKAAIGLLERDAEAQALKEATATVDRAITARTISATDRDAAIAKQKALNLKRLLKNIDRTLNPLKVAANHKSRFGDLFMRVYKNRIDGGRLKPQEVKYLQDFKHNFVMDPVEIKALFCPASGASTYEFQRTVKSNGNWTSFLLPCLKEMGFGHRAGSLEVSLPARGEDKPGVVAKCDWKPSRAEDITSYLDSDSDTFPENLYHKQRNAIKIKNYCTNLAKCDFEPDSRFAQRIYHSTSGDEDAKRSAVLRALSKAKRGISYKGKCLSNSESKKLVERLAGSLSKIECENILRPEPVESDIPVDEVR